LLLELASGFTQAVTSAARSIGGIGLAPCASAGLEVEELQGLVQMVFAGALKPEEHLLVD
jgi:hypothetical protein